MHLKIVAPVYRSHLKNRTSYHRMANEKTTKKKKKQHRETTKLKHLPSKHRSVKHCQYVNMTYFCSTSTLSVLSLSFKKKTKLQITYPFPLKSSVMHRCIWHLCQTMPIFDVLASATQSKEKVLLITLHQSSVDQKHLTALQSDRRRFMLSTWQASANIPFQ